MQEYEVSIKGKTPYMQDRMVDAALEEWEKKRGRIIERDDVSKEDCERASICMYKDADNNIVMPSEHIRGALINAGGFIKAKVGNQNKNMKNVIAAMFYVTPENIPLGNGWIIDKRSAVNHNIKGRIIKIRPKWMEWQVSFVLKVDNETITEQTIKKLLEYAGDYVGVGSFRPQHNGQFGRFDVVTFKKIK